MAPAPESLLLFALTLSVGFGLLLVYFVRREGPTSSGLDWESAEQVARRDDGELDGGVERPGSQNRGGSGDANRGDFDDTDRAGPDDAGRGGSGNVDRPDSEW